MNKKCDAFLLGSFFNHENGGSTLIQNNCGLHGVTAQKILLFTEKGFGRKHLWLTWRD
jgi:hypothetical protein